MYVRTDRHVKQSLNKALVKRFKIFPNRFIVHVKKIFVPLFSEYISLKTTFTLIISYYSWFNIWPIVKKNNIQITNTIHYRNYCTDRKRVIWIESFAPIDTLSRKLGVSIDFAPSKLKQGYGEQVILRLFWIF